MSIPMPMSLPAIVLEPVPVRLPFEERTVENVFNTHGIKNADGTVLINMDGLVNLFDEKLTDVTNIYNFMLKQYIEFNKFDPNEETRNVMPALMRDFIRYCLRKKYNPPFLTSDNDVLHFDMRLFRLFAIFLFKAEYKNLDDISSPLGSSSMEIGGKKTRRKKRATSNSKKNTRCKKRLHIESKKSTRRKKRVHYKKRNRTHKTH